MKIVCKVRASKIDFPSSATTGVKFVSLLLKTETGVYSLWQPKSVVTNVALSK